MSDVPDRLVAALADAITRTGGPSGTDTRPADGAVMRFGKVTSISGTKVVTDATGAALVAVVGQMPAVGDVALILTQGPVAVVVGTVGGTPRPQWTTYTPTLGGTGTAMGNSTTEAAYIEDGDIVHFYSRIALGSTATIGSGSPVTVSLPVPLRSGNSLAAINAFAIDSGTGYHDLIPRMASLTTMQLLAPGAPTPAVSTTVPFTWVPGDAIDLRGTYRRALA